MWKWLNSAIVILIMTSCDRLVPAVPQPQAQTISIAYLKSLYAGVPLTITQDYSIAAWVVSTDQFGGWYKTLIIEDATAGIELKINDLRLFESYWIGNTLMLYLNRLTLGSYGGTLQLGAAGTGEYQTDFLSAEAVASRLNVTGFLPEAPRSRLLQIGTLAPADISRYVRFDEVQFIDDEVGLTLEETGGYATRHIIDHQRDTLEVRIPPDTRFGTARIPATSGTILGIVSYFNGTYSLRLNSDADIAMLHERF